MSKAVDLIGRQFEDFVVKEVVGYDKSRHALLKCVSSAGEERVIRQDNLVNRGRVGVGNKLNRPHGAHGATRGGKATPEWISWRSMIQRCTDPHRDSYKYYGGRGIQICDRWQGEHGFENFLADMGPRPEGTTLDRKEANGNYEPDNCRWASQSIQSHNRRKQKETTSKYRGVYFYQPTGKFVSSICLNHKRIHLGSFPSEIDAALVYNDAAKRYHGEHANLNQIPESVAV